MSKQPLVAIITGAGGGLGKVTATAFLAAGASVAICDVNAERLAATTAEWTAAGIPSSRFLATTTDVTDTASVQKLVADTVAQFGGRLDVLVNNAGIMDDYSGVAECTRAMWDRVMGVNILGPYLLSQAAVKQFLAQDGKEGAKGGVIVNIASAAGTKGHMSGASYTASKHALVGLSKNTAFTYADREIYSVALVMGAMQTNVADALMRGEVDKEAMAKSRTATPIDHKTQVVSLDSVAKMVIFLSDRAMAKATNGGAIDFKNNWPSN